MYICKREICRKKFAVYLIYVLLIVLLLSIFKDSWKSRHSPTEGHSVGGMRRMSAVRAGGANHGLPQLQFLPEYRNPCWLESAKKRVADVTDIAKFCSNLPNTYRTRFGSICKADHAPIKDDRAVMVNNETRCSGECRLRCLPYVYVAGFAKAGTTDMCTSVMHHPMVSGTGAEYYFWNQQRFMRNHSVGVFSSLFDQYTEGFHSQQLLRKGGVMVECTSMTMHDNSHWTVNQPVYDLFEPSRITANDIFDTSPQSKFIVLLRDPTNRLYSHYNMFKGSGGSPEGFHRQAIASIEWWRNCTEKLRLPERRCLYGSPSEMPPMPITVGNRRIWWGMTNYSEGIRIGMYAVYLKDWFGVFPRTSFVFIKHEEYAENKTSVLQNQVLPFLGLEAFTGKQIEQLGHVPAQNARKYNGDILPETKKVLDDFYAPFNERLAQILGDKKWKWAE